MFNQDTFTLDTTVYTLVYDIPTLTTSVYNIFGEKQVDVEPTRESISQEQALDLVRTRRNEMLVSSDWTQLPDSPLSEEEREQWRVYRQALRDITESFQWNITKWPETP